MDVRENSSLGDGDASEELVQLFVVADGELDVARDDPGALVVLGGVSGELEKFGGEVLEDGGEVHGSTGTYALGEASLTKISCHPSDGELESGLGTPGCVLALASLLSFSCWHLEFLFLTSLLRNVLINLSKRLLLWTKLAKSLESKSGSGENAHLGNVVLTTMPRTPRDPSESIQRPEPVLCGTVPSL